MYLILIDGLTEPKFMLSFIVNGNKKDKYV